MPISSEEEAVQLREQLSANILEILCHGFYTCICGYAIHAIGTSPEGFSRRRVALASIMGFMWILATVATAITWYSTDFVFIVRGTTRDAMWQEYLSYDGGLLAYLLTGRSLRAANVVVAEAVMIWRCWIIYAQSWLVILPILCVIMEIIAYCFWTVQVVMTTPGSPTGLLSMNWRVTYNALTVVANIVCTAMIITRIIRTTGLKGSRTFRGIIEILVESCVLYSVTYVVFLIMYLNAWYDPHWNSTYLLPSALLGAVTGITPALIIARVASGKARPSHTWKSSLHIAGLDDLSNTITEDHPSSARYNPSDSFRRSSRPTHPDPTDLAASRNSFVLQFIDVEASTNSKGGIDPDSISHGR